MTQLFHAYGHARPEVLSAAQAIMRAGWRVTSIVRPDSPTFPGPNHAKGIALDVAPLVGGTGGFGPRTGLMVLAVLKENDPLSRWWVVGESDHFHIQLAHDDRVGVKQPGGRVLWYQPSNEGVLR